MRKFVALFGSLTIFSSPLLTSCTGLSSQITVVEQVYSDGYIPAGWVLNGQQLLIIPSYAPGSYQDDEPYFVSAYPTSTSVPTLNQWGFPETDSRCLRISPDGSAIVDKSRRNVTNNIDGSELIIRTDWGLNQKTVSLDTEIKGCPAWSSDSRQLAVVLHDEAGDSLGIFSLTSLAFTQTVQYPGLLADPTWSPSGNQIALSLNGSLSIIDLTNGQTTYLHEAATTPTWSPDGQYIAYIEGYGIKGDIVIINNDGSNKQYLTKVPDRLAPTSNDYDYIYPMWSPNGDFIAVSRIPLSADQSVNANYEVVLIPIPDSFK